MKKLIALILLICAALPVLAGCGGEPEPMEPTEPALSSAASSASEGASWLEELQIGDTVWVLHHTNGVDPAKVCGYRFLARADAFLITAAVEAETHPTAEKMIAWARRCTKAGGFDALLVPIGDCYGDADEAWAEARDENEDQEIANGM